MKEKISTLLVVFYCCLTLTSVLAEEPDVGTRAVAQLVHAGDNRSEITKALETVPKSQKASLEFLVAHMPEQDLQSLSADFLLENVRLAHEAREESRGRSLTNSS